MTAADKKAYKIARKQNRIARRKLLNAQKLKDLDKFKDIANEHGITLAQAKSSKRYGCWSDSKSPTGYTQICDWQGTCQSPCNGDC